MIAFQKLTPAQREQYNEILFSCPPRGCEYSFANLSLWGLQKVAFLHGCAAFFSHYYGRSVYPYPIGNGDRRAVIAEILQDASSAQDRQKVKRRERMDKRFFLSSFMKNTSRLPIVWANGRQNMHVFIFRRDGASCAPWAYEGGPWRKNVPYHRSGAPGGHAARGRCARSGRIYRGG